MKNTGRSRGLRTARKVAIGLALALSTAVTGSAFAQYPDRPIRLIHGFGPGGPADAISRILADPLSRELKQSIVVEAKPGAGGNIGADAVAKAEPDGYTIGLATGGHAVSGALYSKLPFDPVDSFQMITTVVDYSFVLAVRPNFEAQTIKDFLALAKAKPGTINVGTAGIGSTQHLTSELLASTADIKVVQVPYRGDAAAIVGLLGDQVHAIVASASAVLPQVQAGTLKAIAVSTGERWSGMPDVPAIAEALPGFEVRTWAGVLAPKGLPQPVLDRLHAALVVALKEPEVKQKIETLVAGTVRTRTPDEMRAMVASEIARWKKVVETANIPKQ